MSVVNAGWELFHAALDFVLPAYCVVCQSRVETARRSVPLCDDHVHALPEVPDVVCLQCSRPIGGDDPIESNRGEGARLLEDHEHGPRENELDRAPLCGPCRTRDHVLEFTRAGYIYRDPLRRVVHDWKFGGSSRWGHWLGERLASTLGDRVDVSRWDCLVPIPLSGVRLDERGFNQAEQLAVALSSQLRLPVVGCLRKRHATPPQSNLPRKQRLRNLSGTFETTVPADLLEGHSVLLVDDIYTTGTTLETAGTVLLDGGAGEVGALVLARSVQRFERERLDNRSTSTSI